MGVRTCVPAVLAWLVVLVTSPRSGAQVVNVGPPCFACHGAAPQTDFICETDNGCVALGLSEDLINALQEGDPRCPASAAAHR